MTITAIFYCLLTNPAVYHRLTREIRLDDTLKGTDWFQLQETLLKLSYLNAVTKETLRLYPPNCLPMERIVASPGMETNGYFIPEGTVVSMANFVTHRDPEVFGKDAHLFRPERWLEASTSALKRMEHNFMAVRVFP